MEYRQAKPNHVVVDGAVTTLYIRRWHKPDVACLIDTEELDRVRRFTWNLDGTGYARSRQLGVQLHRMVMNAKPDEYVDHIHGNALDNRKSELRITNLSVNGHNRCNKPPKNVYWSRCNQHWYVQFMVQYVSRYFGCFKRLEDATKMAAAVREKLRRGECV